MTEAAQKVLDEILKLTHEEQLWLLDKLPIHTPPEEGYDEAWKAEIERRMTEVEAGTAVTYSWEGVEAKLRAQIDK